MKNFLTAIFLFLTYSSITQDTLRVPTQFTTIQEAFTMAGENMVVLVGPGTYVENLIWPEDIKGIQLLSEMGSLETIIDGNNNGRVLFKDVFSDSGSIIRGFTLRNGLSNEGAGLYIERGATDLIDLNINNNETIGEYHCYGGGVRLTNYTGLIKDVVIANNVSDGIGTANAGGMFLQYSGSVTMDNVRVSSNKTKGGNSSNTAGMFIDGFSNSTLEMVNVIVGGNRNEHNTWGLNPGAVIAVAELTMDSCRFSSNSNIGASNSRGGGLTINVDDGVLTNCSFSANGGGTGSGLRFTGDENVLRIENSLIAYNQGESAISFEGEGSQIDFVNCIIANNAGYAVDLQNDVNNDYNILNFNHCTMAYNDMTMKVFKNFLEINNSILWSFNNGSTSDLENLGLTSIKVRSSIVKNGYAGSAVLDQDPLLEFNSYIPDNNSPAVGIANPNFTQPTDINGNLRALPANSLPDIGAVEINQSRASVDVRFFYDEDKNGLQDIEDLDLGIGVVEYKDIAYPNFRPEGIPLTMDLGNNILTYNGAFLEGWELTTDASIALDVPDSTYYEEINFGLKPINDTIQVRTHITMDPFRCDEYIDGQLTITNEFSTVESCTVWLTIDPRIDEIDFTSMPPDINDGMNVGWIMEDLLPTEKREISFTLKVPAITGQNELGAIYDFYSRCEEIDNSEFAYGPAMRCSYDPNDKQVNITEIDTSLVNSSVLNYTIRFQNTGNDYAKDVKILDTLEEHLIAESFAFLRSSHSENLIINITDDHIVEFYFKDIFLIDSLTNAEQSQGFVSFSIRPVDDLIVNDEISNTGAIYFDSNPPIITNTIITTITEPLSSTNNQLLDAALFYPNPTNGVVNLDQLYDEVYLWNITGEKISSFYNVEKIDISLLEPSTYIVTTKNRDKISRAVIIKD